MRKLQAAELRRRLGILLLAMAAIAAIAGAAGGHSASYGAGIVGGLALIVWAWRRRGRPLQAAA